MTSACSLSILAVFCLSDCLQFSHISVSFDVSFSSSLHVSPLGYSWTIWWMFCLLSDASAAPTSPSLYKPHQSPSQSPSQELFYTPVASPERRPIDTGPTPEEPTVSSNEQKYLEGWGPTFHQAMEQIQQASRSLDEMHSQFRGLLASGNGSDGPRIAASAIAWEARLTEVRKELKSGLRELGNLKSQYEALSAGTAGRKYCLQSFLCPSCL